jgi:sodium-dependent phosphate transporter
MIDAPQNYYWIVIASMIVAFTAAFGIGANDVANAYATSVGAKSLTLKQAIFLAAIFEFCGAFFLGAQVTDTIARGIVSTSKFEETPALLMLGMLCALCSVSFWLIFASWREMPVSTTHTIVSSVVGFSICAKGWAAVKWPQIYLIIASWFISPILSGILSMIIFFFVRTFILRANNSLNRGYTLYPLLIGFTIWLNVFLFLYKGSPSLKIKLEWYWGFLVAVAAGIVVALILTFTVVPCMKKHVDNYKPEEEKAATDAALTRLESAVDLTSADGKKVEEEKKAGVMDSILNNTIKTDIHASLKDTESEVSKMHARAEVFDYKTEEVFKYLQIFTAIFDS